MLCLNPGLMIGPGTNTLVERRHPIVIDTGAGVRAYLPLPEQFFMGDIVLGLDYRHPGRGRRSGRTTWRRCGASRASARSSTTPAKIREDIDHRPERERQILAEWAAGVNTIAAMVGRIYAEVPKALHRVAAQSVQSHLVRDGRVAEPPQPGAPSRWTLR